MELLPDNTYKVPKLRVAFLFTADITMLTPCLPYNEIEKEKVRRTLETLAFI